MSIHRSPGMDRDAAEQLVAGEGVGPVASVLRAAAAPPHLDELAGEEAAVAAFREAATAVPAKPSVFRKALAKALTVKAVIALAIAGSTGIVLAASEGALPMPWSNSPADPPATTTTTAPPPEATAPNAPGGARTSDGRQPPANPDPSIVGLCNAYAAHEDKNLDSPAFRALVEAAGGKNKVAGYCEAVETAAAAEPGGPAEPGKPSTTGRPEEPGKGQGPDNKPASPPGRATTATDRQGSGNRPTSTAKPDKPDKPDKSGKPSKTARTTKTERTSKPAVDDTATKTPGSPALGAATAVPPSGAEPPSTGG